ncbi:IclR family transcriptional regulator C-terminal domain-containing protein [Priestia megaterium]
MFTHYLGAFTRKRTRGIYYSTELAPIGIGTITDQKKLRNVLKEAKEKGYTISTSELENFTTSVSAPIVNHQNEVVAGISVAGIEARFQGERLPFIIQK